MDRQIHASPHVSCPLMRVSDRHRLSRTVAGASRALVAIAVRSMAAGSPDVTVTQHRVLVVLEEHGALSVNALAERMGVDQSNASRHCSRLARLGLVSRTRAAHDGRAVDVRLTTAGRRQIRAVDDARRREIERVLAGLPDSAVPDVVRGFELFHRAAETVESSARD
jgi:DNA-binding MarR family transcriptional regulator